MPDTRQTDSSSHRGHAHGKGGHGRLSAQALQRDADHRWMLTRPHQMFCMLARPGPRQPPPHRSRGLQGLLVEPRGHVSREPSPALLQPRAEPPTPPSLSPPCPTPSSPSEPTHPSRHTEPVHPAGTRADRRMYGQKASRSATVARGDWSPGKGPPQASPQQCPHLPQRHTSPTT